MNWNLEEVKHILLEAEKEILSIRPSKFGATDRYMWLLTKSGEYTAKSGYQAASMMSSKHLIHSDCLEGFNWEKEVWNLACLPKIKFFLWKLMKNALPTRANLCSRGINLSATCPLCGQDETQLHLFFHCNFAKHISSQAPVKYQLHTSSITHIRVGIEGSRKLIWLPPTGLTDGAFGAWLLWMIWTSRNKLQFENKSIKPIEAIPQAVDQTREWNHNQSPKSLAIQIPIPQVGGEVDSSTVRCFMDAAWREDSQNAGFRWIFSENLLSPERHGHASSHYIRSPLMAEAIAMLIAIQHASELCYRKLLFASDSQQLINALNSDLPLKENHGILQNILGVASSFEEISFTFILREKNRRADEITKNSISSLLS
ncbi:PREDICTED: uncharacterized protein LOC104698724 [Camelina sativa]|uniref:Uncharacterized protein LOC104698724 n=1 Tax=Camelina sativa TaxID=90675 RepID=A0ABM0SKF8_CAMSA|nr:PREDICTED: uncharacterized protein LOC104698724 [Camelina sativa]